MLAGITDRGRAVAAEAMATYAEGVREHFLRPLTRPQMSAMGENCRRVTTALKTVGTTGRVVRS